MQAVCTVKVTVRLAGSCRRMGGVYRHLEQWVGFAGVLPPEILTNQCRIQNRPSSPLEDYCFSTVLTLQWKVTARVQPGKNRSV